MEKNKIKNQNNKNNIKEKQDIIKNKEFQKGWSKYMKVIHHIPDPNKNGDD